MLYGYWSILEQIFLHFKLLYTILIDAFFVVLLRSKVPEAVIILHKRSKNMTYYAAFRNFKLHEFE